MMEEENDDLFRVDGELLPDHELINKIKDILENGYEKLSISSIKPLDITISSLDRDNTLPSILKLSFYIEFWAINRAQNDSTRENLSFSQEGVGKPSLERNSRS
jgi:hypothetical protein